MRAFNSLLIVGATVLAGTAACGGGPNETYETGSSALSAPTPPKTAAADPTSYLDPRYIDVVAVKALFGAGNGWVTFPSSTQFTFNRGAWTLPDGNATESAVFGLPGDIAMAGLYGGLESAFVQENNFVCSFGWQPWMFVSTNMSLGVYRPSAGTFYLDNNNESYNGSNSVVIQMAAPGDMPVVTTNYENDDCSDGPGSSLAVYRPSSGTVYVDVNNGSLVGGTADIVALAAMKPGDLPLAIYLEQEAWNITYAVKASAYAVVMNLSMGLDGAPSLMATSRPLNSDDIARMAQFLNTGSTYVQPF